MKSNAIVRIIIWSLVLILLVGILVAFICPWLFLDPLLYDNPPAETAIPRSLKDSTVQESAAVPLEKMLTFPAADISELEIEWVAGNITIYPTDRQDIAISEAGVTQTKYEMTWDNRNGKLTVKFCDDSILSGIGTGIHADLSKDLYVYVPKGWTCSNLEIDAASADVKMRDMTIQELDFDGASGICNLTNCSVQDLDIDTASGNVQYTGTLDVLDFDGASASFTADLQNTPSRIDMDSMSGKLDIALPEDCGFTATMDGMNCTFRSDFQSAETKNKSHVYGDGRCRINVDGMSCDVTIRKLDAIHLPAAEAAPAVIDPTEEPTVPCTGPNCGDPACPEYHGSADCTDPTCPRHHAVSPGHHQEPHSGHH